MFASLVLGLLVFGFTVSIEGRSYEGYYVVVLNPSSDDGLQLLREIQGHYPETVSFWSDPVTVGRNVTLAVDPNVYIEIAPQMHNAGVTLTVVSDNLQDWIDREVAANVPQNRMGRINIEQYNRHSEINSYLDSLSRSCRHCTVMTIGQSYEGRDMKVLKLSDGSSGNKRGIWIDGGIHAREWISPATVIYIIDRMTDRRNRREIQDMLKYFDWYILPVANPDGYEYTWTTDRLWRKTRSANRGYSCKGTDPNRNFGHHWMETGASDYPCSDVYGGTHPFSEPETAAMANFLNVSSRNFDVYLTFHSYGQYWLTPWGYTSDLPSDYDDLYDAANSALQEISSEYGTTYTLGSSTNVLYAAAGGSDDWAKGAAGIKFSYTIELQDSGWYGFVLPPDRIIPQGQEMWAGLQVLVKEVNRILRS